MTGPPSPDDTPVLERPPDDRLDSWKEIAAYMRRDVTTVQRWEKREGMPVHRHVHDRMGSVYAFKSDLDAWAKRRTLLVSEPEPEPEPAVAVVTEPAPAAVPSRTPVTMWLAAAGITVVAAALLLWQFRQSGSSPANPIAGARFSPLTDFDGIEQAAAISRDGRFVAFLSDRDGQADVWVTQVGMGQFYNLTRGSVADLSNPSVRTLGFSPDGTLVTFWSRRTQDSNQSISVWGVPVLGGEPRPYLEGAAEFDWSSDGARLVYHTPGPGDPMYVREANQPSDTRPIFSAPAGLHSHFLAWSPDKDYIYFVLGSVPDRMDIWRIAPAGGTPERMTHHDSYVSHPVFLSADTLLYLASDSDGSGPWIHSLDIRRRISRRVSDGLDRYTSLAADADGRRLVATMANPKDTLWRLPIHEARAGMSSASRVALTTGSGSSPRLGADYLLYVSSTGSGDSIWKLHGDKASELWRASGARIIGAPAIARDGGRIAFSVRQNGETLLSVANADGTNAHVVTRSLALQGTPAWRPDGQAITVAAVVDGTPRLFTVTLDGRAPVPLTQEYSVDPVWSPDGRFIAFSGPDIGTTFDVKAIHADGRPYRLPRLTLTRGARHLALLPGERLVVLRGDLRHKNLWRIDLSSGAEQQVTDFAPDFDVHDFDVSPDGREVVLQQVREHADVVLLELPRQSD
jgi:Tol biopolymer transport system component